MGQVTNYSNLHLYTSGGTKAAPVGPLSPDDADVAHNGKYSFVLGVLQGPATVGKNGKKAAKGPVLPDSFQIVVVGR